MPDLKSEESAEQRIKKGKELKMLRQSQMFSRLPIYLPQLKAGNNSKKLENEIRQLLYRFIIQRKTLDLHTATINLKFLLQHEMMRLIYLIDRVLFQRLNIILSTLLKNMKL